MEHLLDNIMDSITAKFGPDYAPEQLYFAMKFDRDDWLRPAISQLVERRQSLKAKDMDLLGIPLSAQIVHVREMHARELASEFYENISANIESPEVLRSIVKSGPPIIAGQESVFGSGVEAAVQTLVESCKTVSHPCRFWCCVLNPLGKGDYRWG
jgi:hypothetical protein